MSPPATSPIIHWFASRRNLRLTSGLVLFTYVTLHLCCHALGLVSLDVAEEALRATVVVWHSAPGTMLLYGAATVHIGLALLAIYDRRTLRMAPLNALRIVLGLVMPLGLIGHFVGTRYAFEHFGLAPEYSRVAADLWSSGAQGLTLGLLAPGWVHGCLGLRFAFGHRRVWQRLRFELFAVALLLPVLAGLGFVSMGRELTTRPPANDRQAGPSALQRSALDGTRESALLTYGALLGLVVLGRLLRRLDEGRRRSVVRIVYPGRTVSVPRGWSVLDASRSFAIAHLSMCGGRGRCSTCRVRVVDGADHCPAPQADERLTLDRIGAPPDLRLACQPRPTGDISVELILTATTSGRTPSVPPRPPRESEFALLFFDLRLAADRPAADVSGPDAIYAFAQYQAIVSAAIESAGGAICSRRADYWLALFGLDSDVRHACRQAIAAARRIEPQAIALRARLSREMGLQTDFTIGVHAGAGVAGVVGEGEARTLSAVGEVVDGVAALERLAVTRAARFIVSPEAAAAAAPDDVELEAHRADIA